MDWVHKKKIAFQTKVTLRGKNAGKTRIVKGDKYEQRVKSIAIAISKIRPYGAPIKGMGGKATGPIALMQMSNEIGRHVMQGGSRRSALWAGLHWNHGDIDTFIGLKN